MALKTASIIKIADISKVKDRDTQNIFEQFLRFMYRNQNNIYDDLSRLENLPEYLDNATAIAGGLTTGQFYRNGDAVQVVH